MAGIRLTPSKGSGQAAGAPFKAPAEDVVQEQATDDPVMVSGEGEPEIEPLPVESPDEEVHVGYHTGRGGLFEIRGGKRVKVTS